MKKNKILLGVVAAAALCGMEATAQINYQTGDLLAGFRKGGSPDVILDLGSISLYQQVSGASFQVNANLSTALQNTFGTLSTMQWSIFGVNDTGTALTGQSDANTVWSSKRRNNAAIQSSAPFGNPSSDSQALAVGDIKGIGNNTGSGSTGVTDLAPGIVSVDATVANYTPDMGSPYNGDFEGTYSYNIERTGTGVLDLYEVNPNSPGQYLGNFSLSSGGDLTFNPVPEPSTWAMLGTGLLTLVAIRRNRNK
jgi:hypothetical protein